MTIGVLEPAKGAYPIVAIQHGSRKLLSQTQLVHFHFYTIWHKPRKEGWLVLELRISTAQLLAPRQAVFWQPVEPLLLRLGASLQKSGPFAVFDATLPQPFPQRKVLDRLPWCFRLLVAQRGRSTWLLRRARLCEAPEFF